jgi:micrococcal nuclease
MELYNYNCKLIRVVDGDTVEAMIDMGFDTWTQRFIDLEDFDAAEIRTTNPEEKEFGIAAKAELEKLMTPTFTIKSEKYTAFGRSSAIVINADGVNVNEEMKSRGYGLRIVDETKTWFIKGHNVILGTEK